MSRKIVRRSATGAITAYSVDPTFQEFFREDFRDAILAEYQNTAFASDDEIIRYRES